MIRSPPRASRTTTRIPCTSLVRSGRALLRRGAAASEAHGFVGPGRPDRVHPARDEHERAHPDVRARAGIRLAVRSEEQTSELQSLMRRSYAVFCLTKKKQKTIQPMSNRDCNTFINVLYKNI